MNFINVCIQKIQCIFFLRCLLVRRYNFPLFAHFCCHFDERNVFRSYHQHTLAPAKLWDLCWTKYNIIYHMNFINVCTQKIQCIFFLRYWLVRRYHFPLFAHIFGRFDENNMFRSYHQHTQALAKLWDHL